MANDIQNWLDKRVGTPTIGQWCYNFELTKAYADENSVPLLAMYTNHNCSHCELIITKILDSDTFKNWMQNDSKCVFCAKEGNTMQGLAGDTKNCYSFCRLSNFSSNFPYFRLYWPKGSELRANRYYQYYEQGKNLIANDGTIIYVQAGATGSYRPKPEEFVGDINSAIAAYEPSQPDVFRTVAFDANGGTVTPNTRSVKSGDPIGELPVPSRSGYTLVGWFTAKSGGTEITAETPVTADATYYARWTAYIPPDPEDIKRRALLGTMFGLNKDCTIITKDNRILQYSAQTGRITATGWYSPTANLAVSKSLS